MSKARFVLAFFLAPFFLDFRGRSSSSSRRRRGGSRRSSDSSDGRPLLVAALGTRTIAPQSGQSTLVPAAEVGALMGESQSGQNTLIGMASRGEETAGA